MTTLTGFNKITVREINSPRGTYNTVMIIDDSDADRLIFSQLVTATGFSKKILEADSAAYVMEWLSKFGNKPDDSLPGFIFLDLLMPEMNGFEFLDAFDKLPTAIKIRCKIIVFTSTSEKENRKKVMHHKTVYDFFSKPLKAEYFNKIRKEFRLV
ncbi:MAG TPA: response regulator [Bacteroidia bacterium]|nr:response regulator [Bacteroidia bacterium]